MFRKPKRVLYMQVQIQNGNKCGGINKLRERPYI